MQHIVRILFQIYLFDNFSFALFFIKFCCSIVALQCCVSFYCTASVNQLYVYIDPLPFGPSSHLGHQSALSKAPSAIK